MIYPQLGNEIFVNPHVQLKLVISPILLRIKTTTTTTTTTTTHTDTIYDACGILASGANSVIFSNVKGFGGCTYAESDSSILTIFVNKANFDCSSPNRGAAAVVIHDSDMSINGSFVDRYVSENGDAIFSSSNHSNNDREYNLTIGDCIFKNITAGNDYGSIYVDTNVYLSIKDSNYIEFEYK